MSTYAETTIIKLQGAVKQVYSAISASFASKFLQDESNCDGDSCLLEYNPDGRHKSTMTFKPTHSSVTFLTDPFDIFKPEHRHNTLGIGGSFVDVEQLSPEEISGIRQRAEKALIKEAENDPAIARMLEDRGLLPTK